MKPRLLYVVTEDWAFLLHRLPMARAALSFVVRELLRRNKVDEGLVYLQITRGTARRDHAAPNHLLRPNVILTARRLNTAIADKRHDEGVHVITRPDQRWARCDIKSTALLPNVLAKTAARNAGAFEAWLVDREGRVTEGSSTTAWIVDREGRIVTPGLSNAILPGVTRQVVLRAAADTQLTVVERFFNIQEACSARECFLTAATLGVIPVTTLDGRTIGDGKPGPVTRRVQELYSHETLLKAESPDSL